MEINVRWNAGDDPGKDCRLACKLELPHNADNLGQRQAKKQG